MSNALATLDNEIAPFGGPLTHYEMLYQILLFMERMAEAMERSARVHEAMLDEMQRPVSNTENADTAYL